MENVVNDTQAEVVVQQQRDNLESAHTEVATVQGEGTESAKGQSPEENSKFAELRRKHEAEVAQARTEAAEKARQEAKDQIAKELFAEKGVKSYQELQEVLSKEKMQKKVQELVDEGYSEDQAKRIIRAEQSEAEINKFKAEKESETQKAERVKRENAEFLDYFQELNDRPFTKEDIIPQEVWDRVSKGEPLKYAYIEHQLAQLKTGSETKQKNAQNAEKTTGNIDGVDNKPKGALTEEDIEKMSEKEINARWDEVKKVLGMKSNRRRGHKK